MKIGKPKTGGGSNKKYFKLKQGDNVYRILPPLGDLADSGVWAVYHKVHYGYTGLPDSSGKARMRPFVSPEVLNRKTRMVEVSDAAKERIEKMKSAMVDAKERGDNSTVEKLKNLLRQFNLDNKWYVNAMNLEGEIGLLKIPHKAKQALDSEIKRLEQEGVEALGVDNGRFFVFTRSGQNRDTQYGVRVHKQKIEVQGLGMVEKDLSHTLTADIIARLESESHKLDRLYPKPTAEQVAQMVNGGPAAVEEILGSKKSGANDDSGMDDEGMDDEDVDSYSTTNTGSPASFVAGSLGSTVSSGSVLSGSEVSGPTTTSPSVSSNSSGAKIGSTQTQSTSTAVEATAASSSVAQTPEEFLKSMGL